MLAAALGTLASAPASAHAALPAFTVSYSGSGANRTIVHSTPPNAGGGPDHDSADDSETQRWSLRFDQQLALPGCSGTCHGSLALTGASGKSTVIGKIDHVHVDGLYTDMNASLTCTLRPVPAATSEPQAAIDVSYNAKSVTLTALDPIGLALLTMPADCANQGDAMDGIADNYFSPGFSFEPNYGPTRWFTSARVVIERSRLAHAGKLSVKLSQTPAGTPPRDCGTGQPSYVSCTTTGAWSGVLTLTRAAG